MNDTHQIKFLRRQEVIARLGISRATFHVRLNCKLLPPAVSLGHRAKGYVESEINTVLAAMVAGSSEKEIKQLVQKLVEQRKARAAKYLDQIAA